MLFSLAEDSADFDDSFGNQITTGDSDLGIETTSSPDVTTISATTETNSSQNLTSQEVEDLINQLEEMKEQFNNENSVKVIEGKLSIKTTQLMFYYCFCLGNFVLKSEDEVLEAVLSEQVANDPDVINFKIISIELLSPNVRRYRRSEEVLEYLVTFEVTLTADENVEINNQLTKVLSQIDNFEPDSLVIVSEQSTSEDSKFIDKSRIHKLIFDLQVYDWTRSIQRLRNSATIWLQT